MPAPFDVPIETPQEGADTGTFARCKAFLLVLSSDLKLGRLPVTIEFSDVVAPPSLPACTPEEILLGPYMEPFDRIARYSDKQFEQFIEEWAFFYLQKLRKEYKRVLRLGGSGDMGRDVIGYIDPESDPVVIDVYQCKHYAHPIQPSELWPELAKICVFAFEKRIPIPRKYYITAPQNCGPDLTALLDQPNDLKDSFIAAWKKKALRKGKGVGGGKLTGELENYVNAFDFTCITCKPILEVVEELRMVPHKYSPRFGGGLIKPPPEDLMPPEEIAASESGYVDCLLEAYRQHKSDNLLTCESLQDYLREHFKTSRIRYYCAETIREFSRDTLPTPYTFAQVQDQIYYNIADIVQRPDFADGYYRVIEAVKVAPTTPIQHPLASYLKVASLQGICHQLANEGKVKWVI